MKKSLYLFLVFLLGLNLTNAQLQTGEDLAVASTNSGKVRGYISNGILTYKGIPYATANRFEEPKPVESWEGIRSSMTYGPVAPLETPTVITSDEMELEFLAGK